LPAWATLNASTGAITGTPNSTTSATFTIRATDANGCTGTTAYTVTPVCPSILVVPFALPVPTVGSAYSQTLAPMGGTAPYSAFTLTAGTLPAGLTLSSAGVLSGTPTASNGAGTSLTLRVNDAFGCQGTQTINFKVCPVIGLTPTTLPVPTVGTAYSQSITGTGGATPYTYAITAGAIPAWATFNTSTGAITGTPNSVTAASFTVRATDANNCVGTQAYTVTPVCPTMTITTASLPFGTVGSAYSQALGATGGSTPYVWSLAAGTLPAGLTLSGAGVVSGTPTASNGAGTSLTFRVTDTFGCQTTSVLSLRICPVITLTPASLAAGTTSVPYSQSVTASNGAAPYVYAVSVGTLPPGLTLNTSTGLISGTPSSNVSANITISATDANTCVGTQAYTLSIGCPAMAITPATLPAGLVGSAYNQTLTATGGTGAYTWSISAGTLPAGLTLSGAGVLSGTPTVSNGLGVSITARALDTTGCAVTRSYTLQICPVITVNPTSLANATVGTAYTDTLSATGGTGPYTFTVATGSLPAWATLNGSTGVITGTPNNTTAANFTIRATDANSCSGTRAYTITPVCPVITITPAALTRGTVGTAYSQTMTAAGGTGPYSVWTVTAGTLPAGLALNSGTGAITGTPTTSNAAGVSFTVSVNDSYGCQGTQVVSLQICPVITVNPTSVINGTVGTAYSQTVTASGGALPYTFTVSSGSLPTWASLNAGTGVISGTPDSTTNASFIIRATDANGCAATRAYSVTPVCPVITPNPASLVDGTVGTAYNQTITASGGTAPFTYAITIGTLPAGLSLSSTGVLNGTPTTSNGAGVNVTIRVTDTYGCQGSLSYLIQICPVISLSPSSLPNGTAAVAYSQTITASGGATPYVYTVATGSLPAGLTLNASTGVISGTATSTAAAAFTLNATDANGCFGTRAYVVTPICPVLTLTPATLPDGLVGSAYSQSISTTGGIAPYSYAVTSGTLPAGLTLSSAGLLSGTPTTSNGAGVNITIRSTDANGCQNTLNYAIQICPVISLNPATLPNGTVGSVYSQAVTASGGATPYVYAISSGSLPAGLTLDGSTGVISGTPSSPSAANFTITATDANGCAGSRAFTVTPAPNTDFGDLSTFASVSNTTNGTLKLGPLTDAEITATTNATATGDDITGSDDEDGATVPASITAGASITIPVVVTNANGTPAYLNAWVDFNNNASLADVGEQIASDVLVAAGTNGSTINLTFIVPVGASVGANRGLRVRLTSVTTPGFSGTGGMGEIEDYLVAIAAPTMDFGDYSFFLPASSTLLATLKIGALTDVEGGAATNATATSDDTTGSDDEDGVSMPANITQGTASSLTVNVTNTSGASAYLNVWIDFNGDGDLTDPGEQVATNTVIATGTSNSNRTVSFTTLAIVKVGAVGVRTRLTSTATPGPDGSDGNGEVEDVTTNIIANTDFGDFNSFASASSTSTVALRMGGSVDSEGSDATNATATGDDLDGTDDEDGATVPVSIAQGAAGSVVVNVTNTSGAIAYLNAWIDFNRNGVLTDAGEQIAVNTSIATGTSNANQTINFTAPVAASLGTAGVRVRLTSVITPTSVGLVGNGEVEDYTTTIALPTSDFGDELDFADAMSTASNALRLGALVDVEGSSTRNAAATGDDTTGSDDEDGLNFPSVTAGQPVTLPVTVTNNSGAAAFLNAWIDFNNNGSLLDAGEQVATNVSVADGLTNSVINLNFNVPTNAVTAAVSLGTRFRITDTASPAPTGFAGIGEVEDHPIVILAPLTDFGDHSDYADVSNTASTNLRLGALVDTEYASTRNATATGDDITGNDDEDGVTIPAMTAGAPATIPVTVTNNTGAAAFLNAWIDYNDNGVFGDAGEQIATNSSVANLSTNVVTNIAITVPATATTATPLGVRVRITALNNPGATGAGGLGEVEDYVVTIAAPTTDFGDFTSFGSASSTRNATLKLGALLDTEFVQTVNATATGDDITATDDEDSVTFPSMTAGAPATIPVLVTNTSGAAVFLNAWIDANNNGSLADAGEQVATNVSIATGSNNITQNLSITVPAGALTGVNLGARFRLTSTSGAAATGLVGNGEVEDYIVTIAAPTTDFGDDLDFADASQGVNPFLRMGALIDTEFVSTRNATATGDDITGSDDEDGVVVPAMIAGQTVTIPVTISNGTG
ncbi:MAG: putative Ig domain-containing protein, partial [Verrucomicrobia bacterium]|nr:putative Ig domain-containing protein [Verrucomicrobiota bacterium]